MGARAYEGHNDDLEKDHSLATVVTPEEEDDNQRVRSGDEHTRK
jgi:hypothetical protein